MSLFSVCLHFLRCLRSCEIKSGYCKMCSRVKENIFYDYNAFLSLKVSDIDDYLNISSSQRIDLDVFLNRPAYFPYCFTESSGKCSDFEVICFAQDLFATFCSVYIRIHLNITTEYFSDLISQLSLSDEQKVVKKTFTFPHLLLYIFFDLICFFMSFLMRLIRLMLATVMLFVQINQPKCGPYCGSNARLEIISFNFSCLGIICIDIAYNVYKKVGRAIRKTYQC